MTPQCLWAWYNTYVLGDRGCNNSFGEYGSLAHDILKQYHKEELFEFEIADEFEERFNKMECEFPPNPYCSLSERYFEAGKSFFEDFQQWFQFYTMLEVEEEREFIIEGIPFVGYIDYVGRHIDESIHIIDYKSSKPFTKKELEKKIRQLYLYSIPVKEIYGEYPSKLIFLHLRDKKPVRIKFDMDEFEKTKKWAVEQVSFLSNLKEYPPNTEAKFFCDYICSHHNICPFKK